MPIFYDTGYKYPSRTGFSISPYGTGNEWSTPTGAYVEDGTTYALFTDDSLSYKYQSYGDFNFSIPAGYTINGMTAEIAGDATASEVGGFQFYCTSNGNWYPDQTNYFNASGADDVFSFGMGSAPMTVDDFSNANFKVAIFSGSRNDGTIGGVDYVKVKVYYYKPDDLSISVVDSMSIGETRVGGPIMEVVTLDYVSVVEDELRIYDGIAYQRSVATSQVMTERIPRMDLSWRFRLNGGTPEGKTLRLGN